MAKRIPIFGLCGALTAAALPVHAQAQQRAVELEFDLRKYTHDERATAQQLRDDEIELLSLHSRTLKAPAPEPIAPLFTSTLNRRGDLLTLNSDQVTLRLRERRGIDAVRSGYHSLASGLTGDTTWNRNMELRLRPLAGSSPMGLELSGGTSSLRTPQLFGGNQRRGVGEPSLWREQESWQAGMSLSAPIIGETKISSGFAGSRDRWTNASFLQAHDALLLDNPEWDRGSASWNRIDTTLPLKGGGKLHLYGKLAQRTEAYRDTPFVAGDAPIFPGATREMGARWLARDYHFTARSWSVDGSDIIASEDTLQARWKSLSFKWEQSSWGFDLPLSQGQDERYRSIEHDRTITAAIDLAKLLTTAKLPGLVPDEIRFSDRRGHLQDDLGTDVERHLDRSRQSLRLTWQAKSSLSELSLERWSRESLIGGAIDETGMSDQKGTSVSLLHSLWKDDWDLSINGSYDGETRRFGEYKSWSGGISWSLNRKDLPRLTLALDYNSYDEFDALFTIKDQGIVFSAKADFSRLLKPSWNGDRPTLYVSVVTEYQSSRFDWYPRDIEAGPTVLMSYAKTF